YLAGYTLSSNFPVVDPIQATFGGDQDAFLVRLVPGTYAVGYATYLGGDDYDDATGVAVDQSGNVYLAGHTDSENFPTTPGSVQSTPPGASESYAVKIASVLEPDFALALETPTVTAARRQKGELKV